MNEVDDEDDARVGGLVPHLVLVAVVKHQHLIKPAHMKTVS